MEKFMEMMMLPFMKMMMAKVHGWGSPPILPATRKGPTSWLVQESKTLSPPAAAPAPLQESKTLSPPAATPAHLQQTKTLSPAAAPAHRQESKTTSPAATPALLQET